MQESSKDEEIPTHTAHFRRAPDDSVYETAPTMLPPRGAFVQVTRLRAASPIPRSSTPSTASFIAVTSAALQPKSTLGQIPAANAHTLLATQFAQSESADNAWPCLMRHSTARHTTLLANLISRDAPYWHRVVRSIKARCCQLQHYQSCYAYQRKACVRCAMQLHCLLRPHRSTSRRICFDIEATPAFTGA